MHSQGAHIVTRCQWNTAFDSKHLAQQLQMDISAWSAYKMKRVINRVFDRICPQGQTLKIKKLAVDLGTITYENMMSELPVRLEEALRNALYELIMYPKHGDTTLEVIHEDVAQINVLRNFLVQGLFPWNYQKNYGTAPQIMHLQLTNNRLDVIQMIQEIGVFPEVRKRIAWQFSDVIIKKIIVGLEPNNHQQIINFSEEFIKIQEKETIVQTSINDLKKNIWLWILNYLFTDRGTIFNKVAFVRNTIVQMANHFNISYDAMIELIESAIERTNEYSQVDKGFIAILKLLSEEVRNTTFARVKTKKQKENFWGKLTNYFHSASKRSTSTQKNEFNELVINLSKLDRKRFQKIILNAPQKTTTWKNILNDLIPAAIESLFVALAPSQSKQLLNQIALLTQLNTATDIKIAILDLYAYGVEFCILHQHTSVTNNAFLDFMIKKLAKQQQLSKLVILDHFVASNSIHSQKKTSFIPLFNELTTLYQKEIATTKAFTSEKTIQQIIRKYVAALQNPNATASTITTLEKTLQKWISASPILFWNAVLSVQKTAKINAHIYALISTYGTERFLKAIAPEIVTLLVKIQEIIALLITKHSKQGSALRSIKNAIIPISFEVLWKHGNQNTATFFTQLLQHLIQQKTILKISSSERKEAVQLLINTAKIRTLAWSAREFVTIQQQLQTYSSQSTIEAIVARIEQSNQHMYVAAEISKLIRNKKTTTSEFKAKEVSFIGYLLPNGIHLYNDLTVKFFKQIHAIHTSYSTSQIKTIVHDCFWQSLAAYEKYRGNQQQFIALFKATIFEIFPAVNAAPKNTIITNKVATKPVQKNEILAAPYSLEIIAVFEALKKHLKTTNTTISIAKKSFSYADLFALGLETSPQQIHSILKEANITEKQLSFLQENSKLEQFIVLLARGVRHSQRSTMLAIHMLFVIVQQLGNSNITKQLEKTYWQQLIALIQGKVSGKKVLEKLVKISFDALSEIDTLDQITIVKHIQNNGFKVPEILKTVLVERHRVFELITSTSTKITMFDAVQICIAQGKIDALIQHLITQFSIPTWFIHQQAMSYDHIVNELIIHQPLLVLKTIRSQQISEAQRSKFIHSIRFETFVSTLIQLYPSQRNTLLDIQKLYESMAFVTIHGIATSNVQSIIIEKVVVAWRSSNWSLLTSTNIWNELLWEICGKRAVQKRSFLQAINSIKPLLPSTLQLTYNSISSIEKSQKTIENSTKNKFFMEEKLSSLPDEGITIRNAGLVMLNSYFLMLLERLGAVKNNAFVSDDAQLNAVHYLQFVVTGLTETEESLLTLNKILAGLAPTTPIKDSVDMTQDQKDLIHGMIQAAISYWSAIGQTSVNGFRGNWLVREGILRETEERWELTVEKRPYDVLIIKSPFSFSIIKLPWMQKPLHVTWPF